MSCSSCPTFVLDIVAAPVQQLLDQVNDLKALTKGFNAMLAQLAPAIVDDLSILVSTIPTPPVIDLTTVVDMLSCPLTPLALQLDPSITDPRMVALQLRRQLVAAIASVREAYDVAFGQLKSYDAAKWLRRYVQECMRVVGDPAQFAEDFASTAAVAGLVATLCPDTYNDPSQPYLALAAALQDFTYDPSTFLPTNQIDPRALLQVQQVALAEVKLVAWRQAAVVVV